MVEIDNKFFLYFHENILDKDEIITPYYKIRNNLNGYKYKVKINLKILLIWSNESQTLTVKSLQDPIY